MKRNSFSLISIILFVLVSGIYIQYPEDVNRFINPKQEETAFKESKTVSPASSYKLEDIPEYHGDSYVIINNNEPNFTEEDMSFTGESYSELDSLGRCGVALARVELDTMPTEKRGSIGMIKPSGWHTIKYDIVNGKYLYNRCHLIGYQLTGENANPKNLITCTRFMNTVGMLEFENQVASYVKETRNSVLYRVTPIFKGDNLLASGVQMEAKSIEDKGEALKFNVYVYNIQDGIEIDYKTGNSKLVKDVSN